MISTLHVHGCAWLVPHQSLAEFPHGPETVLDKPDLTLLSPTLRRGLSDATRLFMHVANVALQRANLAPDRVHVIFASAFGEIVAAEKLMEQAYNENSSSPARFRNSVHNTAPGLYSISTKSHLPSTAIAAGWDTVAMGLLEAEGLLSEGAEYVLLVFSEERVPQALSEEHLHAPLAAAFVLSHQGSLHQLGRISHLRRTQAEPSANPFAGRNHPLAPCVLLCRALDQQVSATVQVGERSSSGAYCVEVSPAASPRAPISQSSP